RLRRIRDPASIHSPVKRQAYDTGQGMGGSYSGRTAAEGSGSVPGVGEQGADMCGRYTLIKLVDLGVVFPWVGGMPQEATPRYNIAPSQPVLAIANDGENRYRHFYWGFVPAWAKDP